MVATRSGELVELPLPPQVQPLPLFELFEFDGLLELFELELLELLAPPLLELELELGPELEVLLLVVVLELGGRLLLVVAAPAPCDPCCTFAAAPGSVGIGGSGSTSMLHGRAADGSPAFTVRA